MFLHEDVTEVRQRTTRTAIRRRNLVRASDFVASCVDSVFEKEHIKDPHGDQEVTEIQRESEVLSVSFCEKCRPVT